MPQYLRTTEDKLNPILESAIQVFAMNMEEKMIAKAIKGDLDYQGKWMTLTEAQLKEYLEEELLDLCVYYAMGVQRFGWRLS